LLAKKQLAKLKALKAVSPRHCCFVHSRFVCLSQHMQASMPGNPLAYMPGPPGSSAMTFDPVTGTYHTVNLGMPSYAGLGPRAHVSFEKKAAKPAAAKAESKEVKEAKDEEVDLKPETAQQKAAREAAQVESKRQVLVVSLLGLTMCLF